MENGLSIGSADFKKNWRQNLYTYLIIQTWVRTCPDRDAFSEEVKLEHLQQVFLGFTMGFGFDDDADDIDPCSWLLYEQPGHLYFPCFWSGGFACPLDWSTPISAGVLARTVLFFGEPRHRRIYKLPICLAVFKQSTFSKCFREVIFLRNFLLPYLLTETQRKRREWEVFKHHSVQFRWMLDRTTGCYSTYSLLVGCVGMLCLLTFSHNDGLLRVE